MLQLAEPSTILDIIEDNSLPPMWADDNESTNPWVAVLENPIRNYEMLFAFKDPMSYGFPIIRVCRILNNNDFIVCGPGFDKDINLGDYTKLGTMYCKRLPALPDDLRPSVYFQS